jgi:hypothetical protein
LALVAASCESAPAPPEGVATSVQAESVDSFGVGSGRDGAFTASSAGQIVNSYAAITALDGTATKVTIGTVRGAAAGFAAGNLVLVWRTTGLTGVTSGTQTGITLSGDAGAYELGRVKSVAGSVITLTNALGSARYATNAQIVRVPEYTTASIPTGKSLAPYAWDGSAGGIVVFFATGAVTATGTGTISADGAGFRGGGLENSNGPGGASALDGWTGATPGGGAHKGEGLVPSAYAVANPGAAGAEAASTYGRGNYADGAGGGDAYNAGGGGGGNGGAGGIGGRTWAGDGAGRVAGGLPGVAMTYATSQYLVLGGGGGAGEENNNDGSAGGNGGGVILVRAASLTAAGTISANGVSAANNATSPGDGLGGGGAGGTIVLDVNLALTCVGASAVGGKGGTGAVDPDGPGGGGGGGVIVTMSASGTCTGTVAGGVNGTTPVGVPTAWGAASGSVGVIATGAAYGGTICTAAVLADNHCGGCVADGDCPSTAPLCDTTKNTCGTCLGGNLAACSGTTPTCNTTPSNDACAACTGDNGVATSLPCPTTASPACVTSGASAGACVQCTGVSFCSGATPVCAPTFVCAACNGDNGSTTATLACPNSSAPYCTGGGSCGTCTKDSDCGAGHLGPFCNTATGACGSNCSTDAECGSGNWCDNLAGAGVCQPQVTNGNPVPGNACVSTIASRACVSGVCDSDGDCGLANGDPTCTSSTGPVVCRSTICATTGPNAGKCEACVSSATCATATPVCDGTSNTCVVCNGDDGASTTDACPTSALPFCGASGTCGTCTADTDCTTGTHAGPFCNLASGACGNTCTTDAECGTGNWCNNVTAAGLCQPLVQNGSPVPGGTCTTPLGLRACVAGVCDADNDCGYASGGGACTSGTGPRVCRSGLCAGTGPSAGKCVACVDSSTCGSATPVCDGTSNTCVVCNGDDGTSATDACPTTAAPYCTASGTCGVCATNASCTGASHGGPLCNTTTGACGTACTVDSDCAAGDWCDTLSGAGVCEAKTANGAPVPGGACGTNDAVGSHACVSGVCDPSNDDCGVANGGSCTGNGQCQSGICTAGVCVAPTSGDGGVGDAGGADAGMADSGANDGGPVADAGPSTDAGAEGGAATGGADGGKAVSGGHDAGSTGGGGTTTSPETDGTLEGGGFSCAVRPGPAGSAPFEFIGLALSIAAVRRRRQRGR